MPGRGRVRSLRKVIINESCWVNGNGQKTMLQKALGAGRAEASSLAPRRGLFFIFF